MESFLISNVRNYDNLGVELIANDRVCPMALSPVKRGGGVLGVGGVFGFPRIPIPGFGACNNGIGRDPIGPVVVE